MNGTLWNSRCQHPVGQGFFHTGVISLGEKELHYAYDCGSEHTQPLLHCIESYVSNLKDSQPLEVLFLSHLHQDHVNGLDTLLGEVKVRTVVLPYLSDVERFAVLASSLDGPPVSASFVHLVSNPPRWFADRGVERIIQVERGEGLAPQVSELLRPTLPLAPKDLRIDLKRAPKGIKHKIISTSNGRRAKLFVMPDTNPIKISANQVVLNWKFLTFVHPQDASLERFRKVVENEFGPLPPTNRWLIDVVQNSARRRQLYLCYENVWSDLNLTSLSMYSGPITLAPLFHVRTWCQPSVTWSREHDHSIYASGTNRCAWLGTGDSDLRKDVRRGEFMQHFRPVMNLVYSLALPHHGSEKNFHEELLDIGSPICVIAAGYMHGHPDPKVVRTVRNRNRQVVIVDQYPTSMWEEEVALSVD